MSGGFKFGGTASDIIVTPTGNIDSTWLQQVLAELDEEKVPESSRNQPNGFAGLDSDGNLIGPIIASVETVEAFQQIVLQNGQIGWDGYNFKVGDGSTNGGLYVSHLKKQGSQETYYIKIASTSRGVGSVDLGLGGTDDNIVSGQYSFQVGYANTTISHYSSTFGYQNTNEGSYTLISGYSSTNQGLYGLIIGQQCLIESNTRWASAWGYGSIARTCGVQCLSTGPISAVGDNQIAEYPLQCRTTSAQTAAMSTAYQLAYLSTAHITAEDGEVKACCGYVSAARQDASMNAFWRVEFLVKNVGGTLSIVGSPQITNLADESSGAFSIAAAVNDTNDRVIINVTSSIAANVHWLGSIKVLEFLAIQSGSGGSY